MQPMTFPSARNSLTIKNIIREINKANKEQASIIFVEYGDQDNCPYSPTDDLLKETCEKLNGTGKYNYHFVTKYHDDGSEQIIDLIDRLNLPQEFIKVCGVNTDACVARTVEGLDKKLNKFSFDGFKLDMRKDNTIIEVVWDACNTDSPYSLKPHDLKRHCSKNVVVNH